MKKIYFFSLVVFILCSEVFSQVQSEGEKLFRLNRPEAAIPVLEKEIALPGADPVLYNYLGLSYYQIKKYVQALSVFEKGLALPYSDTYTLNLNAGNSAFALNDFNKALEYYSQAQAANPEKSSPVLNKANTYLKLKRWGDARENYLKFIEMDEENPQTPKIKILIGLLDAQIENDRLAQEALLAQTEQLPDNVAKLSENQNNQAEEELVDGKYVASPLPVPVAEKVDESLPYKTQAQIESERLAEQLAKKKIARNDENLISEEPVEMDEILQDQMKILMAHEAIEKEKDAALQTAAASADNSESMIIETKELDKIPQNEKLSCSVQVLTEDFSPDDDGADDIAEIALSYQNAIAYPEFWKVEIKDQGGMVVKSFSGRGKVPSKVTWDGLSDRGEEAVYSAEKYSVNFEIIPDSSDRKRTGVSHLSSSAQLLSGILMLRKGEGEWKIIVVSFRFDADQATFNDLTVQQQMELSDTLQAIVRKLKKQEDCLITVEGYGNNISGTERENREEVIPLSEKRAKVIMDELIKYGVPEERLSYVGRGDKNPIDTSKNPKNRWKNRRVEFSIKKKK